MTTSSFPTSVHQSIQHYVYRLIDPRNGETFYVGRGKGDHVFSHARGIAFIPESDEDGNTEDEADLKIQRINAIKAAGLEVGHLVHRHGLDEATAKEVEAALIDAYPGLTNQVVGIDSDRGCKHVYEIIKQYGAEEFTVDEPLVIISCYKTIEEGLDPYDAARHAWHLNLEKVQGRLVLANNRGIIAGAFWPDSKGWIPATSENFPSWGPPLPKRYGFHGTPAEAEVWNKYVGKAVPAKYKPKGAVRYCDPDAERNSATSRFTDNPFRDPDATPEQLEWIRKRNEATRIFRETGDRTMAVEIGVFAPDPPGSRSDGPADEPPTSRRLRVWPARPAPWLGDGGPRSSDAYGGIPGLS